MPDINARRDLFMFTTTVEIPKRDVLSHRLLGNSNGTAFKMPRSSQTT
jgi:hypothetical protein